jgi:redox-sensitive bicupin YhaK (pirin superfamily)
MMIRKGNERGHFKNEWLKSFHTFSFGDYYDPKHMHFSDLRVINHDWVSPSSGFPTHPHRDMEIISYVLNGRVEHEDSMGNKKVIHAGEIQVMSAGTGVLHSEYNPDSTQAFELMQIWIMPKVKGIKPHYEQKELKKEDRKNKLQLLVSPDNRDGSIKINQEALLWATILESGKSLNIPLHANKKYWLQVANGSLRANDFSLETGDGLAVEANELKELKAQALADSEFLLFELNS